jgi:hypothetical protein
MESVYARIDSGSRSAPAAIMPVEDAVEPRKVISHRIRTTFALSPLVAALSRPKLAKRAVRIAVTVVRYFFYPQFETRLNPRKRPVVNVDHPLDETVPFRPDLVAEYLTFFFLWINTALFLVRSYGKKGSDAFADYIDEYRRMYRDCGRVYLRKQSTTRRPPKAANGLFQVIHGLDPHLHCVPSLHVLVVVGNYLIGRRFMERLSGGAMGKRERDALAYIRQEAVRITESVLFVKQHSVNCVAVSFFYLSANFTEFGDAEARRFIGELFSYEGTALGSKAEIREYMYSLYRRLLDSYQKRGDGDWRRVVMDYLKEFKANPPF